MRSHEDGVGTQHQRKKSSPFPYRGPEVIPDLRRMSTVNSGDLETHKAQWTTSPVPVSQPGLLLLLIPLTSLMLEVEDHMGLPFPVKQV